MFRGQKMKVLPHIKRIFIYIIIGVFWISVIFTVLSGCFGMFFKSSDEANDDYEEYFHNNLP